MTQQERRRPVALMDVVPLPEASPAMGHRGRDRLGWRAWCHCAATDLRSLPHATQGFPFGTFVVNVSGCLLIGLLMVSIVEVRRPHRLVRPFLGVGLLGGYTTFSTYAVETQRLIQVGDPRVAFAYFGATVVGALLAVQVGVLLARLPRAWLRRRAER